MRRVVGERKAPFEIRRAKPSDSVATVDQCDTNGRERWLKTSGTLLVFNQTLHLVVEQRVRRFDL